MTPFQSHPAFYNRAIRLSAEEQQDPRGVLQEFLSECPLAECRQLLWQMTETALQADHTLYDEAAERHRLLWFYQQVEKALEAGWLLAHPGT